eukprot:TRINITY_DN12758_c0_g1_i1.p1 TRINITY_DN12758_c0_g1~~TRINITY_DN12758_c0_g1_i1.p1  ORF type:complete len:158 (-),score=28.98 TRINITY_DN12758_c0_g1_i1:137-610(-)
MPCARVMAKADVQPTLKSRVRPEKAALMSAKSCPEGSGRGQPCSGEAKIYPPSQMSSRKSEGLETETFKTLQAVQSALRAVQGVLGASQDNILQNTNASSGCTRLSQARRRHKEQTFAMERSAKFTKCLNDKLENLVGEASSCCSTTCGTSCSDCSP